MPHLAPQLTISGAVASVLLRRPALANRLEVEDIATLRQHIAEVNAQADVRVLRLRGAGRHFCSGFNIGSVPGLDAGALFESLANALEAARPVTIAEINGGVYGGATDLALACDFRLGLARSEMFVPAARLGLHFYRGGLERYVSRLGLNVAKRVLLAGATLDAQQMLDCGFLDELHASDDALSAAAEALAQRLLEMAPLALLGMKQHLNAIARGTLDTAALQADIARSVASEDLAEGVQAWTAKRKPRFSGC
jgi:enoyl-CoA hydratase